MTLIKYIGFAQLVDYARFEFIPTRRCVKMQLKESYVIWNDKGGVRKTTLTFHIATRYARCNSSTPVLVIDLCPQANVSMALLSTPEQCGSTHLHYLYTQQKTVSSYLQRSIQPGSVIKASDFLTKVKDYNNQLPYNLFLLCGDMYLELVGRSLEYQRSGIDNRTYKPWLSVTSSIRRGRVYPTESLR